MSDFNQECTVKAWLETSGGKITWSYALVQYNQLEVVSATGFLGRIDTPTAELTVTLAALEQAARLRYEKIEFRSNFVSGTDISDLIPRFQRNKTLKLDTLRLEDLWLHFRFKRCKPLHEEEAKQLKVAAQSARKKH